MKQQPLDLGPPREPVRPKPEPSPPKSPSPPGTPPAPRPSGIVVRPGNYEPGRYKARLAFALAASLWFHAFILSLHFGFDEFALPGLHLPWADRPLQRPPLTIRLAPAPAPLPRAETGFVARLAAPARPALPPPLAEPVPAPPRAKPPHPALITQAEPLQNTFSVPPPSAGEPEQKAAPAAEAPPATAPPPAPEAVAKVAVEEPPPAKVPEQPATKPVDEDAVRRAREPEEARKQEQAVAQRLALELEAKLKADEAAQQQAAALARQKEAEARRTEDARREEQARLAEDTRRKDEAKRLEEARRIDDAKKQDEASAQRLALALEAKRKVDEAVRRQTEDAALQQAARAKEFEARQQEEARKTEEVRKVEEARKLEEARRLAEARRLEELRRIEEAKRQEDATAQRLAQELAAKKQADEAARRQADETAREQADVLARQQQLLERLRGAGSVAGALPGQLSGSQLAAKALEQIRKPETSRDALPGARSLPRGDDPPRRRSILGSTEADISLRMYAESWRVKVERHGNLNLPIPAHMGVRYNPLVTVTIRSDGSVEEVFIHRSSGLREIDEAVRRIVRLLAPYSAFPPEMARQFDAVEIRRVWSFGDTLEIRENLR